MCQLHKNAILAVLFVGVFTRSISVASATVDTTETVPFYLNFFKKLSQWIGEGLALLPTLGFMPSIGGIWGFSAVIFVFLAVFAGISWLVFSRFSARRDVRQALAKIDVMQNELDGVTTILTSGVSLLFVWDKQETASPRVFGTLTNDYVVPEALEDRADFSNWLDPASSFGLGEKISTLRVSGKAFNIIITTKSKKQLEADGCIAGGQATLWLKPPSERQIKLGAREDAFIKLQHDTEKFAALLNALPQPVWLRNQLGRLQWANAAYIAKVKGDNLHQVIKQQLELLPPAQRLRASKIHSEGGDFKDVCSIEVGGREFLYDVCERVLGNDFIGFAVENGEGKTQLGQNPTAQDMRNHLLENLPIAVAQFDAGKKLIFTNEAFSRLWDIDAEFLSSGPTDASVLDRLRDNRCLEERVNYRDWQSGWLKKNAAGVRHTDLWHLPDGRSIQVTVECQKTGGVTYFYEDKTESLSLVSRHKEMMNVQRATLDNLQEAAALFGSDGNLILFNPAYARIWKLSPKLLEANPHIDEVISWCKVAHNDEMVWKELKLAVTGIREQRRSLQGRLERRDNTILSFTTVPLPDGATLLVYDDITNTAAIERMLIERNEALMAADKLKSEFISHVSYQLRTPLTTIIGFSESLAMGIAGELSQKQLGYANDIRSSSDELLALIDDILDLATIGAGTMQLDIDDIDVSAIMTSVARVVRDQVNTAGAQFQISIPGDAGTFKGDEKRIKQMLFNLLSNSLASTTRGGIISLKAKRNESTIEFTVTDTGRGIEPVDQARMFDCFETQNSSGNTRGAGLGLSIVKSFAELHGGTVSLASIPGRGTRITCILPLARPEEAEVDAAQA